MKKRIITLGGLPGSGKSTTKKLLAERLNFKPFSTGDFVRNLARERGMTLEEFNEVVAEDKSLDELIDTEHQRIEKEADKMVIDSHLGFHFVPSAFHVYLNISPEISAARVFNDRESNVRKQSGDSMMTLEEAKVRTQKRIDNHLKRYEKHYGINPYDILKYDLVINTEETEPEEVVEMIIEKFNKWLAK